MDNMIYCLVPFFFQSQCKLTRDFEEKSPKKLTDLTGKEIARAVKVQWRALMLALILLITYSIYWVCKKKNRFFYKKIIHVTSFLTNIIIIVLLYI